MKRKFVLAVLLMMIIGKSYSQGVRLNVYGNYAFDDHVDSYYSNTDYYNGMIKGGFLWGAGLQYRFNKYYGLELLYMRLDTKAPVEYYNILAKHSTLDLGVNYLMLAGERTIPVSNPKIEPFGGLMAGMTITSLKNPDNGNSGNSTKFAWGGRLVTNIWATEKIGIKLQAQLVSVPQAAGGGFYFGTGGGGTAVTTYSTIYQFALGGGLVFKLGAK